MTMIGNDFPVRANAFCLNSEKRASSADMSPAGTLCFDIFPPPPGDSEVISQVERLSSKEMKIAPRSVWMALGASGRSAIICMAVSRVGGRNLTLPERRSLSTSPWDLDTFDFTAQPSLNKALVLELARCEWIEKRQNCIALGPSGTGKTHAALALGLAACQRGHSVAFTT